jgi:hypothetical protein
MFDWKERKEEIKKAIYWFPNLEQSYDEIISQEKLMIAEAKKETRKEFADKIINYISNEFILCDVDRKDICDKIKFLAECEV